MNCNILRGYVVLLTQMDDKILVNKVLEGDTTAFKSLIENHQRLVAHMIARLIDNDLDREELCQDVFMKVHGKLGSFNFDSKLSTWVATIAYREAVNFLKKSKRKPLEEDLESVKFHIDDGGSGFEDLDFSKFIHHLIDQMPAIYRSVLTLYHLDGFSYPEIIKITGLPEGTVKNYLFRARIKLKEISKPYIGKEIHQI